MKWDDVSIEEYFRKVDEWWSDGHLLGDTPIGPQFALDLIFKTLVDDKENYPYLTTMSESQQQINSLMVVDILYRYSRKFRKMYKKRLKELRNAEKL